MINLQTIDLKTFLGEYWQKKPLLIQNALPDFVPLLNKNELAGLALEEDVESRIVFETPGKPPFWQVKRGPFTSRVLCALPKTHWTLLIQGVEQLIPDMSDLLSHFDFIPQWRFDDLMISYAVKEGSVGPHYDNYDVFLFQASGQRRWSLTTQHCNETNALEGVDLRIMESFEVEEEYILMPGDMLYLPPHVGHHGVALDDDCMTYSFGYRSYQGQELWDSYGDYFSANAPNTSLYKDPNWGNNNATSSIPKQAWVNARALLMEMIEDESKLKSWFGCFATRLDEQAELHMPMPLEEGEDSLKAFRQALKRSHQLIRSPSCRMAYIEEREGVIQIFINGCEWGTEGVTPDLMRQLANHRKVEKSSLMSYLGQQKNEFFLYELWKLQWIEVI